MKDHKKSNRRAQLFEYDPAVDLKPGRHACECQARQHGLVGNCLSCGRVVCKQEGSGPCFFCNTFVCTKEERELINSNTRRGHELRVKLLGDSVTLKGVADAVGYRNKLLQADATAQERNKVVDLETDYFKVECNVYLTAAEREAIMQRKEELRQMRQSTRRPIVYDFDVSGGVFIEQAEKPIETVADPVIQDILQRSSIRQQSELQKRRTRLEEENDDILVCEDYIPVYEHPKVEIPVQKQRKSKKKNGKQVSQPIPTLVDGLFGDEDEAFYAEVEQKGFTLALDQPTASFVLAGVETHVVVGEDLKMTGPVFIAASAVPLDETRVAEARSKDGDFLPKEFPTGCLLGRVFVQECLTAKEYNETYPETKQLTVSDGFVVIISHPDRLPSPIPHIRPGTQFYQLDSSLRKTIKHILDPYNLGGL